MGAELRSAAQPSRPGPPKQPPTSYGRSAIQRHRKSRHPELLSQIGIDNLARNGLVGAGDSPARFNSVHPSFWHNRIVNTNHSLRAVIFDYGRVLSLSPSEDDWAAFAAATDLPLETFESQYWKFRDAYDRKDVNAAQYWALVVGRELSENELTELIAMDDAQWTKVNHETLHLARQLKEAGVKIAILSNMQTDMLRMMRAKFDWLGEFDVQMYSCEVGMVKPAREVYLECVRRLGVEPAQTLFLDDKQKNVDGAADAGLKAMLFEGDKSVVDHKLGQLGLVL